MAAPAVPMVLTGVCHERQARRTPRWQAIWSGQLPNGTKVALHQVLPLGTYDHTADEARAYALANPATW